MYYGYSLETFVTIILSVAAIVVTLVAQIYVSSSFNKYKRVKTKKELSGFEVARQILDINGLQNIHIVESKGLLSDHYDPTRKVIRLSPDIFSGNTIAAASVAAHEVGHAIQDKDNYNFMKIRSKLVPIVNLTSKMGYAAIFIGFLMGALDLAYIGIFLLCAMLLFQLITLPVEFNASDRAKVELEKLQILNSKELEGSTKMLRAAAFTYVASLITTVLEILRLFLMANNRRR